MYYLLITLYLIACFILILFVLLQPGKSDAAAVFGGGANSSAFGPRGTQSVMAKVTIVAAIVFFLIAFLFSIPGLFTKRSLGEGVGPAEVQPVTPESQTIPPAGTEPAPVTPPGTTPPATTPAATPPATAPATPPGTNSTVKTTTPAKKPDAKPQAPKQP